MMPFAEDTVIDRLEATLKEMHSVTQLQEQGMSAEGVLLEYLMGDLGVEITDRVPTQYHCNCSKDRVSKAIASIGRQDLEEMRTQMESQ